MADNQTPKTDNNQLEAKDKIDYLFKVINRFDFYVNSTNTKGSLIIAWNGILIGTVLLKSDDILTVFQSKGWAKIIAVVLLVLVGTCNLISNVFVFSVVFPFLRPSSKLPTGRIMQNESMLFFGSVAAMGSRDYYRKIVDSDVEEILTDLADQAATIAQGLEIKMQLIQKSLVIIGLGLIFIFGLLILKVVAT